MMPLIWQEKTENGRLRCHSGGGDWREVILSYSILFMTNCIRTQTQEQKQFEELFKFDCRLTNMSRFASRLKSQKPLGNNTCTLIYNSLDYNGRAGVDLCVYVCVFFSLMIGLAGKHSRSLSDWQNATNIDEQNLFFPTAVLILPMLTFTLLFTAAVAHFLPRHYHG